MEQSEIIEQTNHLYDQIQAQHGNLELAYEQIELIVDDINKEIPIEALIPASTGGNLGMALKTAKGGQGFWNVYSQAIREKICSPDEKLHDLFKQGLATSAGAVVTALGSILKLPPVATGLLVPIASIILTTGLDAFCEWSNNKDDDN